MKMAHLIMTYKDPNQAERLINKLTHEGMDFYVHVDKKSNISSFASLNSIPKVKFTERRFLINWAGYSFTQAVIEGMREILASGTSYDFINLMSSQEYPIKPVEHLYKFYSSNLGQSFISQERYGSEWWKVAKHRVENYHLTDFNFPGSYRLQRLVSLIMPKRVFPLHYTLYGGNCATWWTISRECAEYVVNFIDNNPAVRRFAKFTWAPDEYLIPTIVMNSCFKEKVVNNNMRYIDWSLGGANPKIITLEDFDALQASDRLIARKFDVKVDVAILDKLDEQVLGQPAAVHRKMLG